MILNIDGLNLSLKASAVSNNPFKIPPKNAIGQPVSNVSTTESIYEDHHLRLCLKTSVAFICSSVVARRYIFSNPVIKQGNMKPSVKMEKNHARTAAPRKAKKLLNVSDMLFLKHLMMLRLCSFSIFIAR